MSALFFEVVEPELLDEGYYVGHVEEIEPVEGQFGAQFKFTLVLDDEEAAGKMLTAWVSAPKQAGRLSTRSKLFKWARIILGDGWDASKGLDLDWLVDRPVRINVTVEEKPDGTTYNKVIGLAPVKVSKTNGSTQPVATAPTPPPPPAAFEGDTF